MKKVISQISLILIIMIIGLASVFAPDVYAANATITVPSKIKKGDKFTVTVNIPSEAVGYQGIIKVKYSDGTTDSSGTLAQLGIGENNKFKHPGNMTASFTAKIAGSTTITVEDCEISDASGNLLNSPTAITFNIEAETQPPTTPTTPTTPSEPSGGNTGSSGDTNAGSSNNGNSNSNPGTSGNNGNSGTTQTPKFTDVNETVYTTTRCNLRESYSTSSNKVAVVDEGTKLTRKGVGDNGWSKVEYNGKTVYVSSQYVTTTAPKDEETENDEKEVVFKDTHENLYAKQSCNLRASWSTESEKVGYLTKGQAVERTGYAENGWSRILYNGKTVYVASRLLSVEKPEEDPVENTTNENTVTNSVVNNTVTNEVVDPTQMSEEDRLKELEEEIGVLPEVGINAANIAYVIVTIMAICGIAAGIVYMKKIK